MLNSKTKWIAAAAIAALAAVPAIGQASHYTGTVPTSVMMAAATSTKHTARTTHVHRALSVHRKARVTAVSHKKTTTQAVKHKKKAVKKKHHKKSKKA